WRKRRKSVRPSAPGSHQSSRTASHWPVCRACQPLSPSAACSTVKPSSRRPRTRKSAIGCSSSITRMRNPMSQTRRVSVGQVGDLPHAAALLVLLFFLFLFLLYFFFEDLAGRIQLDLDGLLVGGLDHDFIGGNLIFLGDLLRLLDRGLGILG